MQKIEQARQDLLSIYTAALQRVEGQSAVKNHLKTDPLDGHWSVVAIGKAAQSMVKGAEAVLGDQITRGLVISKTGHLDFTWLEEAGFVGLESSHPVPKQDSLDAGAQLLSFIADQPKDAQLLFLISGGASSLVEVLPEGVGLNELQKLSSWMLSSGLGIEAMNRIRKSLSMIKGGKLLGYMGERRAVGLFISDVPSDDPAVIGSGLLSLQNAPVPLDDLSLPDWVNEMLSVPVIPTNVASDIELHVVANLRLARNAAEQKAIELGYSANLSHAFIGANTETVSERIALELLDALPGVYIWGGEPSMVLPEQPRRGGRNQHFALNAAVVIEGRDDICLLSAGTDGTDGPGEDAGGLVDGGTLTRGKREGFDALESLKLADSGTYLEVSGDLVNTGPTGTNVMDLILGLKIESQHPTNEQYWSEEFIY